MTRTCAGRPSSTSRRFCRPASSRCSAAAGGEGGGAAGRDGRSAGEVREELVKAGATMTVSLEEVRRQLAAPRRRSHDRAPRPRRAERSRPHPAGRRRRPPTSTSFARPSTAMATSLLVATSGEDALKVARRARPSLVLLDVLMPGIDGYETCRRLKADPATADAAVIFLSALDDAREKVRGLEAGAVDFVTKPFQPEEVVARVHTHLTVQRLQAAARGPQRRAPARAAGGAGAPDRGAAAGGGPARRRQPGRARAARVDRAARRDPGALLLTGPHGAGQEAVGSRDPPRLAARPPGVHPRELRPACRRPDLGLLAGRARAPGAGGLASQPAGPGGAGHALPRGDPPDAAGAPGTPGRPPRGGGRQRERRRAGVPGRARRGQHLGAPRPEAGFHPRSWRCSSAGSSACPRSRRGPRTSPSSRGSSWASTPAGSEPWSSASRTSR